VEHRVGLAAGERLGDQHVDRDAVLGVHHDHRPGLTGVLHGSQDLAVVGVENARVGHEQLEAGDALVVDQVGHRLQRLVVDAADDLVERIVDRAVARRLLVPLGESVVHRLTGALDGEVDDGGDAAPRRGDRAGLERVGGEGAAERQLHVGVGVDAAGDDVLVRGVDDAVGVDAHRRGLAGGEDADDRLVVDQDVALGPPGRRNDRAVLDECGAHIDTPQVLRMVSELIRNGQRATISS